MVMRSGDVGDISPPSGAGCHLPRQLASTIILTHHKHTPKPLCDSAAGGPVTCCSCLLLP